MEEEAAEAFLPASFASFILVAVPTYIFLACSCVGNSQALTFRACLAAPAIVNADPWKPDGIFRRSCQRVLGIKIPENIIMLILCVRFSPASCALIIGEMMFPRTSFWACSLS